MTRLIDADALLEAIADKFVFVNGTIIELITNAPTVQQSEPFGYFKAEPFGWTDCAETDEGAIALYEAPTVQREGWVSVEDTKRLNWLENEIVSIDTFEMDESFGWLFAQYYLGEKEPREIYRSFAEDLRKSIDEAMLAASPKETE